jgi:hypothetical protein
VILWWRFRQGLFLSTVLCLALDSNISSIKNRSMTTLLEQPTASPLLAGLGALEEAVDRLQSAGME